MALRRLFCCFTQPGNEDVATPRQTAPIETDLVKQPEVIAEAAHTPAIASCDTPGRLFKFMFDQDDAGRVIGINNSGRSQFETFKLRSFKIFGRIFFNYLFSDIRRKQICSGKAIGIAKHPLRRED